MTPTYRKTRGARAWWILWVSVAMLLPGCQTTGNDEAAADIERSNVPFEPATYISRLHQLDARHPTLFSPASAAVWVSSEAAELKMQEEGGLGELDPVAAQVTNSFHVFELHLVSAFHDTSMAADVVDLRGVQIYLETPDGQRISPAQHLRAGSREEEPEGALRRFRRTNIVVFPRHSLWMDEFTLDAVYPAVRLVLETHSSEFYFEWPALARPGIEQGPPTAEEQRWLQRLGYDEFVDRLRAFSGMFQ
ncbi:MAG: hypothetical protein ACLFU6_04990 [Candidatus Hydrogenedentota bacterium]